MASVLKFCPVCSDYLHLNLQDGKLLRVCRNCTFQEEETKGGLLVETVVQERTSEAYKIMVNEFTRQDPTLPHVRTIKCPRPTCESNQGGRVERDVIYMKHDPVNLKFLYICNVCGETWKSR